MLINYTEKQKRIVVVDDVMGSGMTSWAIQFVNQAPLNEKFIIVTPFLSEIKRIKKATKRRFVDPDTKNKKGTKLFSLKKLLENGQDIITTHSLFKEADEEVIDLLKLHHYTLIMDEVSEVVERLPISNSDLQILLRGLVEVEDKTGKLKWVQKDYEGKFSTMRRVIETNKVFLHNKTAILWTFHVEVFQKLKRVFVLTYLFDGQIQRYYFDLHSVPYEKKSIGIANEVYSLNMVLKDGELSARVVPEYQLIEHRRPDVGRFKDLIHICYDEKLNQLGEAEGQFGYDSFTFTKLEKLNKHSPIAIKIRNDFRNFFYNMNRAKGSEVMWTVPKSAMKVLSPKSYAKGWVASNSRATNEFKDRKVLGYGLNRFMNPTIVQFFESQGVEVNQDLFALSELVQWVFRSAVRNNQEVQLYIPSERMRTLLEDWMDGKI